MRTSRCSGAGSGGSSAAADAPPSWRCGSNTPDGPLSRMVVDDDLPSALDRGLAEAPDRLIVLPTYSALLALHMRAGAPRPRQSLLGPGAGPPGDPGQRLAVVDLSVVDRLDDVPPAEDGDDVAGLGAAYDVRDRLRSVRHDRELRAADPTRLRGPDTRVFAGAGCARKLPAVRTSRSQKHPCGAADGADAGRGRALPALRAPRAGGRPDPFPPAPR